MNKGQNDGITLIALVITIIIMLILAGVTISLTFNGGLIEYAKEAKTDTEQAQQDQETYIQNTVKSMDAKQEKPVEDRGTNDVMGLVGNGTEEEPYLIRSIEDLVILAQDDMGSYSSSYIKLKQTLNISNDVSYRNPETTMFGDLNMNGVAEGLKAELTSGGYDLSIASCTGTFDGDGYQIRGRYYQNSSYSGQSALFKNNSGTIKDLTVAGNIVISQKRLGINQALIISGIVVENSGIIQNCVNKVNISLIVTKNDSVSNIGGVVGNNIPTVDDENTILNGKIINCKNYGTIVLTAMEEGTTINTTVNDESLGITNCENKGTVKRIDPSNQMSGLNINIGGIAGKATIPEKNVEPNIQDTEM